VIVDARPWLAKVGVGEVSFKVAPFLGECGTELEFVVGVVRAVGILGTEGNKFPTNFYGPGDEAGSIEVVSSFRDVAALPVCVDVELCLTSGSQRSVKNHLGIRVLGEEC
jgi:hypothetical protein